MLFFYQNELSPIKFLEINNSCIYERVEKWYTDKVGGNMDKVFVDLIDKFEEKINKSSFNRNNISENEVEFSKDEIIFKISYMDSTVKLSSGDKKLCEWHLNDSSTSKDISLIIDDVLFCVKPNVTCSLPGILRKERTL